MLEGEDRRRRDAMRATVASLIGATTIAWLIAGVVTGHLLALGAIVLAVMAFALAFTALVASGTEIVPAARRLEAGERRALVGLMVLTGLIGVVAIGLTVADSPAGNAVAAVLAISSAALLGYAAHCLMRAPGP